MNDTLSELQKQRLRSAEKILADSKQSHFQSDTAWFCENALAAAELAVELTAIIDKLKDQHNDASTFKHIRHLHNVLRENGHCIDGGTCHHSCKKDPGSDCFRQVMCAPLMLSGLNDNWELPIFSGAVAETGWLIENGKSGSELRYRTWDEHGAGPEWTDDHMKATRYCRRVDAERAAAGDEDAWLIVEHSWPATTKQPSSQAAEPVGEVVHNLNAGNDARVYAILNGSGRTLPDKTKLYTIPQPSAPAYDPTKWQLVPKEATRSMIDAGWYAACNSPFSKAADCYRAMLQAAPQAQDTEVKK